MNKKYRSIWMMFTKNDYLKKLKIEETLFHNYIQ